MQLIRGFEIKQEDFNSARGEVDNLFYKHWEEIALNKDKIKLNPDWTFYEAVYNAGNLGIYTARKDKALVGYFIIIARPHPHYKDHTFAVNDVLFIEPEHRKGLLGYFLIKYAEKDMKKKGVSVLTINTKVSKPLDVVLERLGFKNIEKVYSKYLGD